MDQQVAPGVQVDHDLDVVPVLDEVSHCYRFRLRERFGASIGLLTWVLIRAYIVRCEVEPVVAVEVDADVFVLAAPLVIIRMPILPYVEHLPLLLPDVTDFLEAVEVDYRNHK